MPAPTPEDLPRLFTEAVNSGDTAAALELWTSEAAMVSFDGSVIEGDGAVAGAVRALIDAGTRIQIDVEQIVNAGTVALAFGTLTMSGTDGEGRPFEQQSSSMAVYAKQGGGWRVALDAPWGLPGR